jgi:hypothetical protein
MFPLSKGRTLGWPTWTYLLMASSAAVAAVFVAYERRRIRTRLVGSGTGAVAREAFRFQSPPVEPCMRFCRTRRSVTSTEVATAADPLKPRPRSPGGGEAPGGTTVGTVAEYGRTSNSRFIR